MTAARLALCALFCVRLAQAAGWEPEILLTPQQGHFGPVGAMSFCQDGRLLVTAGHDGTARLWEVSSGRAVRTFANHVLTVRSVACSPGGDFVATAAEDGTVRVWDVATGKERVRLEPGEGPLTSVAIAPDGRTLLSGSLNGWIRVWDVASGSELRSWRAHQIQIPSLAFSPDGNLVASASFDTSIRLWDVRTGEKLRQWNKHGWFVTSVQFSPDGKSLLSASHDKTARLWSLETGAEIRRFGDGFRIQAARFSPDGNRILAVGEVPEAENEEMVNGEARLWETATGREIFRFSAEQEPFTAVAMSTSQALAASATFGGRVRLWDLDSGKTERSFGALSVPPFAAAASPDGRMLLAGYTLDELQLWDVATGGPRPCFEDLRGEDVLLRSVSFLDAETVLVVSEWGVDLWSVQTCERLRSVGRYSRSFESAALSHDRRYLVTGNSDGTSTLWDVEHDKPLQELEGHEGAVLGVALSPDGSQVLTGGEDGTARLWRRDTGEELRRFDLSHTVAAVGFSPDGKHAFTATANVPSAKVLAVSSMLRFDKEAFDERVSRGGEFRLWEVEGWRELSRSTLFPVMSAAFSADGQTILVGAGDGTAHLLEVPSGREVRRFATGTQGIRVVGFLGSDGRVLTAGLDGFVRIWEGRTSQELARLAFFGGGDWAVVTPDGRFDTNNPGELEGLSWVVSDDPVTPLPVDSFVREYYEPRLLARTLRGEHLPPLPSIANLNRTRPEVRIASVVASGEGASKVDISVEVSGREKVLQRGDATSVERSGAKEVRLFRDGRLVGTYPPPGSSWRLDAPPGKTTITFRGIWLPTDGGGLTAFSAYAFNSDGVKSETVHRLHSFSDIPDNVAPRAYLIHVGINEFEDHSLHLRFAANDARALHDTLLQGISESALFEEVVPVLLVSDKGGDIRPTKARIAAVLQTLSGQEVDSSLLAGIFNGERLRAARPEDVVLVTFSTHGEMDEKSLFYLVPFDSGHRLGAALDPRRMISADELAEWLQGIDSGELVLIIDACRSAASVASPGFKPGPMDSRGLGQLSFNKRMRVLTATQADDVALESGSLQHGFLTYALVHEGIKAASADDNPRDGEILLGEWLRFGERRVPELFTDVVSGQVANAKAIVMAEPLSLSEERRLGQRPTLFDFSLDTLDELIVAAPMGGGRSPH